MNKFILSVLGFFFFTCLLNAQIYISTTGSDDSLGSIDQPYATFPKAISESAPGDTIYVRGGVYNISSTINITIVQSGTAEQFHVLTAYKDEVPILDFSGLPSGDRGIKLQSNYWHIKGLRITKATDNGMQITFGSYNIIENCQFYRNQDTGLQLSTGSSYNQIINCDSYYNADPPDYGDADGFAPKLDVGTGNYFYGCRSWGNCDDGWDGYLRGANNVSTTLENCWTWGNGYRENGADPGAQANGNGFKMGGGDNQAVDSLKHNFTLINCVSFDNKNKGFDQNNNLGSMTLYNCTSYNNIAANYRIQRTIAPEDSLTIKNCASFTGAVQLGDFAIQETNSWLSPFDVTADDFLNLDGELAASPRQADGSLPNIDFLHLAQGSDLIDGGVDLGFSYNGDAPDLGAFESDFVTLIRDEIVSESFRLYQNYPNPFNPNTTIAFTLPQQSNVKIAIYNVVGQLLETLLDRQLESGYHTVDFSAGDYPSGLYLYKIMSRNYSETKKMLLVK